jgi:hypothetical protein
MHAQYGETASDWDSQLVKGILDSHKVNGALQKVLELPEVIVVIRGKVDAFYADLEKFVHFIEVKTTGKGRMWSLEVRAAIRQLQIYLWMVKDYIEGLELYQGIVYHLAKEHSLQIFSQRDGNMLKNIPVIYDMHIEEWIKNAVYQFLGLERMTYAPYYYCKSCPDTVKRDCWVYHSRRLMNDSMG